MRSAWIKRQQSGIGLVEVLVAAAILALTVSGSIFAASRWLKATTSTTMRSDGSQLTGSAMELAIFNPDATWVADRLPVTTAGNTSFSISALSTSTIGDSSATQTVIGTTWADSDNDGNAITPFVTFEAAVMEDSWNQTIRDLAALTPSHDPDHWLYHLERESEPEPEPSPEPEPPPEPEPSPEPSPEPEPEPEPEPAPEPSPWTSRVTFAVTNKQGSGAYNFEVLYSDPAVSSCTANQQTGGILCERSIPSESVEVSITASAAQYLCSGSPGTISGSGSSREVLHSQTLTINGSSLTVSLVVANQANKC